MSRVSGYASDERALLALDILPGESIDQNKVRKET
jgi:hypothetical protein